MKAWAGVSFRFQSRDMWARSLLYLFTSRLTASLLPVALNGPPAWPTSLSGRPLVALSAELHSKMRSLRSISPWNRYSLPLVCGYLIRARMCLIPHSAYSNADSPLSLHSASLVWNWLP